MLISVAVVESTANFFLRNKRVFLLGLLDYASLITWFGFWSACMLSMFSIGEFSWKGQTTKTHQEREIIEGYWMINTLTPFMIFALLWGYWFLKSVNVFALMVAYSTYYFDSNENKDG